MSERWLPAPGAERHGFLVREVSRVDELNLEVVRLEHEATGARMLHLGCSDENNLFGVGFKTPPTDSTGVAHILEHTVLCGSKRYPVRDPFFSMLRRSLNTFMNALTSSDWTLYPFASQNRKDFYNLLGIYLDAVFFPLLRDRDFAQEGWRLEFAVPDDPTSPLEYKGVVFNEMKGAMADPSSLLAQRLATHLYPSTTYRYNSGGEPLDIPTLTAAGLRRFHDLYYHPSNAYIFTYGDLPLEEHLRRIQETALRKFSRVAVSSQVLPEPRWKEPLRVSDPFPLSPGEPLARRSFVQIGWLACDIGDQVDLLALRVLSSLLLGNPAAPLYKALLDAKLGANLAPGTGYHDDYRTTYFAAGLQGTERDAGTAVEELVLSTLERVAGEGFAPERIEGVIHRLEFSQREVTGDHYPYPLGLLFRILGQWIHCEDPITPLRLGEALRALRRRIDAGGYFESVLRRYLVENPHRVTLTLVPDPEQGGRLEEDLGRRLAGIRGSFTEADATRLIARTAELKKVQEAEEDLSCLPTLGVDDIPPTGRITDWTRRDVEGLPLYWFDQPTNGIGYAVAHFAAGDLPGDLVPFVPLFCVMLSQVGAGGRDYLEMAKRIEAGTGGIQGGTAVLNDPRDEAAHEPLVTVSGKALIPKQAELFGIISDIVGSPDFTDHDRLETLLFQIRTSLENSVPGSGHSYARGDAAGSLSAAARLREQWSGLEYIRFVKNLADRGREGVAVLSKSLGQIADAVLARDRMRLAITAEEESFPGIEQALGGFLREVPSGRRLAPPPVAPPAPSAPVHRGWATSVPVSYVARVFATVPYTHPDAPVLMVLARLLRASYLHREIREKGGAYGGMAVYSPEGGLFSFMSYRDPHIARTLSVYDDAVSWASSGNFGDESLKEAILAVFSELDRPLSPGGKGRREFGYLCQGLTREMRQAFREGALGATRGDLVRCAAEYLGARRHESAVSIISSSERLEEANRSLEAESVEVRAL